MVEFQFKVGDAVHSDPTKDHWHSGKTGVVVMIREGDGATVVEFHNHGGRGHDKPFRDGRKGCWYFYSKQDAGLRSDASKADLCYADGPW